jgi:hypothetical protein
VLQSLTLPPPSPPTPKLYIFCQHNLQVSSNVGVVKGLIDQGSAAGYNGSDWIFSFFLLNRILNHYSMIFYNILTNFNINTFESTYPRNCHCGFQAHNSSQQRRDSSVLHQSSRNYILRSF